MRNAFLITAFWAFPIASGHILALRRCASSSIGSAYTSVWHRTPDGRWTFYSDIEPSLACSRYFGAALADSRQTEVSSLWTDAWSFVVEVPAAGLFCQVRLAETVKTRLLNFVFASLPDSVWRNALAVEIIGANAGRMLGAGSLGLTGSVPNRQRFLANPRTIWIVRDIVGRVSGVDLEDPERLPIQDRLGDYVIPQRGLFAIGRSFFERFDPACHLATTAGAASHRDSAVTLVRTSPPVPLRV